MNTFSQHVFKHLAIRFPGATLMTFSWTITLILKLVFQPGGIDQPAITDNLFPIIHQFSQIFCIGIPLFILISISHSVYASHIAPFWFYLLGIILLSFYGIDLFFLKSFYNDALLIKQEFFTLLFFTLISISFVPFLLFSMRNFWKFNNILFIKLIKTIIYCSFSLLVVNGSLFVVDFIFNIGIYFWIYQFFFILIFCLFGCCYFLCQIPQNLKNFESDTPFPTFYYLFSNGYLLPFCLCSILAFYGLLFYYLLQWTFPHLGIIVIFCVIMGVSVYLTLQYELLRSRTHNIIVAKGLPFFYTLILPLCLFFCVQLFFYFKDGGITEFWYLIFLYLIWISILCLYFITSKRKDIRFIPISLAIILFLLLISPLKPFTISVSSQYNHLLKQLRHHELLNDDSILQFNTYQSLSRLDQEKIINYLYYLENHNRLSLLAKHYPYPILDQSLTLNRLFNDLNLKNQP